jgi:hypothetical protein
MTTKLYLATDEAGLTLSTVGTLAVWNGTEFVNLPVGTDGDALVADSLAPAGLSYAAAGGGAVDPYLVINSGPPDGFFGFPGDVLLAPETGIVRPAVTRYLPPSSGSTVGTFVVSTGVPDPNVALVLSPKGTGGLQAQVADGTIAGGNARGNNAVDLQTVRTASTQVASGARSVVGGGERNTASGSTSFVGGGLGNMASSPASAVTMGNGNTASSTGASVGGGQFNTASNSNSTIGGGLSNTASGIGATVAGGERALADQRGMFSHASGLFAAPGDAQFSRMILRRQTTDATPLVLTADGTAGGADDFIALPAESAYCFDVYVIATQTGGVAGTASDSAWWHFRGGIRRDNANNTTLIGSNTEETSADAGAAAWVVTVTADDTNEALQIEVTGEVDKTIRWVATVQYVRVAY